jgi:oligosaccharide repeat unit polymerase
LFEFRWGVFKVLALLVGVFVVVPAIVGERGEFFSVVLMALLIRHKRRPYSNLSVVVTALVVILSFGFIFLWRTQRALMFSQSDYGKLFVSSLVAGNSLRVVGAAAELFPGVYEYSWGRSYYAQLVGKILPVLGWQLVQGMPLQDLEPARWITWVMELRLKPDLWPDEVGMRVAGWGYSMIAEAFQNFGGLGVVIVMALFGGLAALLDRWHVSSGPAGELAASLFIANLLLGVRNSFGNFLNRVVIGLAVVALFWLYCELTTKKEGCGRPISMPKSHAAALTGRKAESV